MLLTEFFGKAKPIHLKPGKDKDEDKMNNELFWFILDHDRLHKDYFYPISKKLKANADDKSILDDLMDMVKKGCKEFYAHNKMEGKLGKLFPEELRKDVCQKLYDHYRENLKKLMEGGNLSAGSDKGWHGDPGAGAAQQINLQVTNRSVIVPILNDLLAGINSAYQAQYKQPLWDPKLLKSQKFLSGSSLHFFNVKGIPDKVFVEKKPKVGDIDTMVDKEKEIDLENFLKANINQTMGPGKLLGFQRGNEQFSSLWELQDPPIKIQIDLEYVKFDKAEPTPWSRFSHSSDWNDLQAGVKGVFHKFLIQSFAVLTKREFILRKQEGRGKSRDWVDKPTEDAMFSFAVASKEGGGLRAKYTPVLNPTTNEPEMKDGLPVMMALPAAGYEQDIGKMFQSLFGVKMNPKAAEKLADKFWSFTGLLEVMNTLLDPEEKSRVLGSFLNKTFGAGAQGLYKNDPERDSAEKMAAIELLMKTTGAKPPEGMDLEQMRQEYVGAYKMTEETLDEADDITAPPKPNYSRQGIPHIYNRLPDGRVSSMEMKDLDFIELCKEIADNGGTLNGVNVTLKVDGAGIRFGKDEAGRPFFMTSKVTEPLYADNVGYFTNFGIEKGQSQENLARTKKYDDALSLIVNSDFIKTLPADTIVQAEMLYNDMAENVDGQLKFVNIPYDAKKLGKQMTLVPFMVKQYSTGDARPDQDKVIQRLLAASDPQIKIVTNKLEQQGINVSKIIDPVVNMDANLINALRARGSNPDKEQAKQILDQAKQALSSAIIDSPKLKGKDALGPNNEGIVVNMPGGRIFKVTSQQMKSAMAAKNAQPQTGDTKTRTAVVAIGNFAGHRGHEDLINHAIKKAQQLNGTPFVYVGAKVGADDPIDVETKIQTLQKLFPGVNISPVENQVSASGEVTAGNHMKKIEYELVKKEPHYNNIVITVGTDQADSMNSWAAGLQKRFAKFPPLSHVKVSVDPLARGAAQGGSDWSTTALRNSLKTKPEDQAFQDWSRAYNVEKLGADWIRHLMDVARKNMGITKPKPAAQPQPVAERLFNALVRPRLDERMMPASNFAGTPKNKLGPAAHLKGKMKRPARAGDLVGDAQEGYYPKDDQFSYGGRMPRTNRIPQDSTAGQEREQAIVARMKQNTIDAILSIEPGWGLSDLSLMTATELNQILRDLQAEKARKGVSEGQYTIAPGDNLSTLSKKFGTSIDALMKMNPNIKDANRIQAGAKLNVPNTGSSPQGAVRTGPNTNIKPDTRQKAADFVKKQPTATAPQTTPGNEKAIASVLKSGPGFIEVKTVDGEIQRRKGNANWRMNNPGNIRVSPWTKQQPGFIGAGDAGPSGQFAVFASLADGMQAKKNLLFGPKSKYFNLSIRDAITRYAPPSDNNPTDSYINQVVQGTKATPDTPLSKLTTAQQDAMMSVINKVEGFKVGSIETISNVAEAGPFRSTEPNKPRKGSVADLAAKKRKEQERNKPPIEPRDQMVGVAKVTKGVSEVSGKNVVKSVKVGNFRHDLVDTGMGWQVRIYNGDELYDTGMSKNSEQKGLSALEDAVAYTEKLTRTIRQDVSEGIPKNAAEKKLFELLQAWSMFISFKTVKLTKHGVDQAATNELLDMFRTYQGPVINGMKWTEITKGDLWQNPKVIPHLLKYIYQAIPYVEARIKKFVRPEEQAQYLDYIDTYLKPAYKEVVGLYSNPSVSEKYVPLSEDVSQLYGNYLNRILLREISGK